jgi:hypothetical protein
VRAGLRAAGLLSLPYPTGHFLSPALVVSAPYLSSPPPMITTLGVAHGSSSALLCLFLVAPGPLHVLLVCLQSLTPAPCCLLTLLMGGQLSQPLSPDRSVGTKD